MWKRLIRRNRKFRIAGISLLALWGYLLIVVSKSSTQVDEDIERSATIPSEIYTENVVWNNVFKQSDNQVSKEDLYLPPDEFSLQFDYDTTHNFSSPCRDRIYSSRYTNQQRLLAVLQSRSVWKDEKHNIFLRTPKLLKKKTVLATAASDNHFMELETFLSSVYDNYRRNYTVIVYDIGLTDENSEQIRQNCDFCEYRKLNFSAYPDHVKEPMTYAWKPIITYLLLHEYESFIWCDTSVRFKNKDLRPLIRHAKQLGIATYDAGFNVTCLTQPAMFRFFREQACLYKTAFMIEANFIAWGSTQFSRTVLGRLWVACAMDTACIAPPYSRAFGCDVQKTPDFCICHRFDQSALTILLYRLLAPGPYPDPWVKAENNPWIHPVSMCDISRGDAGGTGFLQKLKDM